MHESNRAERMIADAFDSPADETPRGPGFGEGHEKVARIHQAPVFRQAWAGIRPLLPQLAVPEVLALAVQLLGSIALLESEQNMATPAVERAVLLFDTLHAEGFTAREIANVCATLLAGLVLKFP